MISESKKARMLNMFKDGFNPYRISKFLKIPLSTVRYNMNKWIGEGMLIRINPNSTPVICEPGINYYKDNRNSGNDFAITISNYDILTRLHSIEGTLIESLSRLGSNLVKTIESMGNGGLIQNKIIIDKKSLNISNDDLTDLGNFLERRYTKNKK